MPRPQLTDVGVARDFPEDVDLLGGGFPQLLDLLGGYVARCDVDDLHGILLPRGFVNAPPDDAAHPPARNNMGKMGCFLFPLSTLRCCGVRLELLSNY